MPRLLVSIVNWNTRDELRRCLAALERAAVRGTAVAVVDNASSDGSADMVRAEFPHARLIANATNAGFAAGNNLVLADCDAEYCLVLNPDVEVDGNALDGLLAFLETHRSAAAVAPALIGADARIQSHLYRRFPTTAQVALFWTVLKPLASRIGPLRRRIFEHDLRGTAAVQVQQIPGAAMLIRTSALRMVGLFDPGYFIWWEDVDWCRRAAAAGFTIHVLPSVRVRHAGGASFGAWSVQTRVFQFYRAFYRFLAIHGLHELARSVTPVIRADLAVKDVLVRIFRLGPSGGLSLARRAVREAVHDMESGTIPEFRNAEPPGAAPLPEVTRGYSREAPIDVVIVNWNGRRWLSRCVESLRSSTVPVRITLVDNASTDGSTELAAAMPDVQLIRVGRNAGYAGGANIGLAAGSAPYAYVMNPDVIVEPDHLRVLRDRFDDDVRIGAAQGKLYGITPAEFDAGITPRATLDSAGHEIRRSRMVVDRGQGEADSAEYAGETSVFSACGAALFLRRSMLDDVAPDGEYFAESFFAYKEDIDLGWRARILGWDVRYIPAAVAHHVRAVPLSTAAWRGMSPPARRHSWKNHYLLLARNDRAADIARALPFIAGWELLRMGHALLRDPSVLGAYIDAARALPAALRARRDLLARRRTDPAEIRRWFGARPLPVGLPPATHAA